MLDGSHVQIIREEKILARLPPKNKSIYNSVNEMVS